MCAVLAVLGFGAAWAWWAYRGAGGPGPDTAAAEVEDPRLTFPTPYRNVRPEVKYAGDQVCAGCHAGLAETYRHHPMGQALAPVAAATPIERYGPAAHDPFAASGLHYGVRRDGDRAFHREWIAGPDGKVLAQVEAEVRYAVGSGANARSYLIDRDGYLFQSPATWYPRAGRWDLSPGYETRNQHFGRPITPACLFCHSNSAEHVPGTVNRYRRSDALGTAIGCERCHGPGELHVRRHEAAEPTNGPDDTIVNPARLEYSLREAVCHQCHVQGEERVVARGRSDFDYRPGLPLYLFQMDFVDARDRRGDFKFVSSVEQMTASRCYAGSREPDKLGCTSCHDPHKFPSPEEKVEFYRQRCLKCHTEASCSLPPAARRERQKDDSCIACHMPRTGNEISHTAITDHRIPRRPDPPAPAAAPHRTTPGPGDLVPFDRDTPGLPAEEVARNRGLAMMGMLDRGVTDAVARRYAEEALPLLEQAVQRDGRDWPVAEARADALWSLGRKEEALSAYEAVLAARPESESALHGAGNLALALNRPEDARSYLERAVLVNPWNWRYYHGLAVASFRRGEWDRAVRECREALRLEPSSSTTRSLLVQCFLGLGQAGNAQAEYETLRQTTSEARRPDLQRWFDEQRRRFPPGPR